MASAMTAAGPRPMCFKLRRLSSDGGELWQWVVYSYPDLAFLRDGQIAGGRDKAERAARAAIAIMGGTSRPPEPTPATSGDGAHGAVGHPRTGVDDP